MCRILQPFRFGIYVVYALAVGTENSAHSAVFGTQMGVLKAGDMLCTKVQKFSVPCLAPLRLCVSQEKRKMSDLYQRWSG